MEPPPAPRTSVAWARGGYLVAATAMEACVLVPAWGLDGLWLLAGLCSAPVAVWVRWAWQRAARSRDGLAVGVGLLLLLRHLLYLGAPDAAAAGSTGALTYAVLPSFALASTVGAIGAVNAIDERAAA